MSCEASDAADRDWERFHTPRNLALALAGKVGELCAEFQWLPEGERMDDDHVDAVRSEIADVFIYLIRLSDVLDVDLHEAAREKMALNAARFPTA